MTSRSDELLAAPAAVHLFVSRSFQVIPEPDSFIQGAMVGLVEQAVRAGYDVTGTTLDPGDEEDLLARLERCNRLRPGTAGIHLTFVEAPTIIGFGTAYSSIHCAVYAPCGAVALDADLLPPLRRSVLDLLLPPRHPDVEGRGWGAEVWAAHLAPILRRRG